MTYREDTKPGDWIKVVRCLQLNGVVRGVAGKTLKEVAFYLATYAEYGDGSRVHPGTARIAVECEVDYRTAKRCLAAIRDLGLIRLVRSGTRRGYSDEYQLTIPADLHDRGILRTPAEVDAEIERIRQHNRRASSPATGGPDDTPGTGRSSTRTAQAVRDTDAPVPPVDNPPVRDTQPPVQEPLDADRTGNAVPPTADRTGNAVSQYGSLYAPPPPTTKTTQATDTTEPALRTTVTPVDHPQAAQDPLFPVVDEAREPDPNAPSRCERHPLPGGLRDDGQPRCALCRVETRRASRHLHLIHDEVA